jgi:hypothetical protein
VNTEDSAAIEPDLLDQSAVLTSTDQRYFASLTANF